MTSGRLLFTVRCSPLTNVAAALAAVKGMSATGQRHINSIIRVLEIK